MDRDHIPDEASGSAQDTEKRKADRRNELTESLIRDSLFDLLDKLPLEKITVSRLCEEASINRSTFYKHYRDVRDVIDQITDNYYSTVYDAVIGTFGSRKLLCEPGDSQSAEQTRLSRIVYETEYGLKILRHPDVFIRNDKHSQLDEQYVNYMLSHSTLSEKEIRYFYAFITYGLMGMTRQMLENNDYHDMADKMDRLYRSIISEGLNRFMKE